MCCILALINWLHSFWTMLMWHDHLQSVVVWKGMFKQVMTTAVSNVEATFGFYGHATINYCNYCQHIAVFNLAGTWESSNLLVVPPLKHCALWTWLVLGMLMFAIVIGFRDVWTCVRLSRAACIMFSVLPVSASFTSFRAVMIASVGVKTGWLMYLSFKNVLILLVFSWWRPDDCKIVSGRCLSPI